MTSFVTSDYPSEHPGVVRAEAVVNAVAEMGKNFDSAKTLATLLSAAVVATVVVVADRLIDAWADGHLLATWVMMWAVAFAALGLFAPMVKTATGAFGASYQAWSLRVQDAREEEAYWQSALNDPRIMAEYQAAKLRFEQSKVDQTVNVEPTETAPAMDLGATLARVTAELSPSKRYLRYV